MPRRAKIFYRTVVGMFFMLTLFACGFFLRSTIPAITITVIAIIDIILAFSLYSLHRGKVRLAGTLFASMSWGIITFIVIFVHGSQSSPAAGMYVVMTVLCAMVLGVRAGYLFGGLSLISLIVTVYLEQNNLLPGPIVNLNLPLKSFWYLMVFLFATTLVDAIVRVIDQAFQEASDRADELALKNQELEEIRQSLEERVVERTHEILREKQYFETLLVNSPVAIVTLDLQGRVVSTNPTFERLFGYTQEEMKGKILDEWVADPNYPDEPFINTERTLHGEMIYQHGQRRKKDGSLLWVEIRGVPVMDGDEQAGLLAIYYDVTEQRRIQEELRASEKKYRDLFENMQDAVYRSTTDGRFLTANPAMMRMLGYDRMEELLALNIRDDIYVNPADRDALLERQRREGMTRNIELVLRRKDGQKIVALENAFAVRGPSGEVEYYEGTLTDITERKHSEERLRFLATHDPLTGLPNRASFFERLNARILDSDSRKNIAVMFLDLDGFKEVNDRFGHARGDALLRRVAGMLQDALRPGDMVARLGGDEFAFFFDDVDGPVHAAALATRVIEVLSTPVQVMEMEVHITSSIGISLFPYDGADAEILLKRADTAMYRVKESGKNSYEMFAEKSS